MAQKGLVRRVEPSLFYESVKTVVEFIKSESSLSLHSAFVASLTPVYLHRSESPRCVCRVRTVGTPSLYLLPSRGDGADRDGGAGGDGVGGGLAYRRRLGSQSRRPVCRRLGSDERCNGSGRDGPGSVVSRGQETRLGARSSGLSGPAPGVTPGVGGRRAP